jgi:hypothetical protein
LFSTTGKMMALHNGAVKTFWPSLKIHGNSWREMHKILQQLLH